MVSRTAFINKIRELGYKYKNQQKRTYLYRKIGGTHRIFVPMCDLLEDDYVASVLRQVGLSKKDIDSFIGSAKS
jgi:hypothetical protein